jgi:hypothetical protein
MWAEVRLIHFPTHTHCSLLLDAENTGNFKTLKEAENTIQHILKIRAEPQDKEQPLQWKTTHNPSPAQLKNLFFEDLVSPSTDTTLHYWLLAECDIKLSALQIGVTPRSPIDITYQMITPTLSTSLSPKRLLIESEWSPLLKTAYQSHSYAYLLLIPFTIFLYIKIRQITRS